MERSRSRHACRRRHHRAPPCPPLQQHTTPTRPTAAVAVPCNASSARASSLNAHRKAWACPTSPSVAPCAATPKPTASSPSPANSSNPPTAPPRSKRASSHSKTTKVPMNPSPTSTPSSFSSGPACHSPGSITPADEATTTPTTAAGARAVPPLRPRSSAACLVVCR